MDVEKLIDRLKECGTYGFKQEECREAAEALTTLQAELEKVKAERNAAVEYLRGQCRYCKRDPVCTGRKGPHSNCWEWRGQQRRNECGLQKIT